MSEAKPIGSAIRTYTGVLFDFVHPELSPISIDDIAHSLSLLCRFAGHCKEFYSVAEHSVRVSDICPPEHAFWGLMHDASEAYCVDIPRPLKYLPGMEVYRQHEKRAMKSICSWFNMDPVEPPSVKEADMVMLVTEQRDLLNNSIPDFQIKPLEGIIRPWGYRTAKQVFLNRFHELRPK